MAIELPKMLRELVLIKYPIDRPSGLELPESYQEEKRLAGDPGEVVSVGKDVEDVKVGDTVIPKAYVGNAIPVEDEDNIYIVISELDIMAIK